MHEDYRQALDRALCHICNGADTVCDGLNAGDRIPRLGRMRHVEAGKPRLGGFPQDNEMPYGNYWIAEWLYRELSTDWSALSPDGKA